MSNSLVHDERLVVLFRNHAVKNNFKSQEAGRPIFDDVEIVEIRAPGSKDVKAFPATDRSHWSGAQYGDEQVEITYAERFAIQYRQFKAKEAQTISGTPLAHVPFLTEARRAELRALSVYTVEQLAAIDGQELKNIGQGGRELKNKAQEFIDESKANAPNLAALAELETLKARNAVLEEDMQVLKALHENTDNTFDGMSLDQLREFIKAQTGHEPHGANSRKTLERMARDAQRADA